MKLFFPAKLIIAGEWNVLLPQRKGLVTNINRYLSAEIQPSDVFSLKALPFSSTSISFDPNKNDTIYYHADECFHYPLFVIQKTMEYLQKKFSISLSPFLLTIDSSQFYINAKTKLGLGSSAASTVAIIKTLFQYAKKSDDNLEIFFLACACYREFQQVLASGIDIASTLWPGFMEYSAPEKFFSFEELLQIKDFSLVVKPYVHHFAVSSSLQIMAVYLKQSVSTSNTLKKISLETFIDSPQLAQINQLVKQISICLQAVQLDIITLKELFSEHISLLSEFSHVHDIDIMNNHHFDHWLTLTKDFPIAAKNSGTGAYDCGIALSDNRKALETAKNTWNEQGFISIGSDER